MSDQKTDTSELLAGYTDRIKTLEMCFNDCNEARIKAQREVEEQEQEIADLNREIATLKGMAAFEHERAEDRLIGMSGNGWWSRIGNWIKRLAK